MANIALNKPSGGQLILSPEDGTSTETVTIPSVGVGKVLQVVHGDDYADSTVNYINASVFYGVTSVQLTRMSATSKFVVVVNSTIYRPATSGWHSIGYRINGGTNIIANAKDSTLWSTNTKTFIDTRTGSVGDVYTFETVNSNLASQTDQVRYNGIMVMEVAA